MKKDKQNRKTCAGCGKPLYEARAQSRYGHGEICTRRMFSLINCYLREAVEGDFISKEREERNK